MGGGEAITTRPTNLSDDGTHPCQGRLCMQIFGENKKPMSIADLNETTIRSATVYYPEGTSSYFNKDDTVFMVDGKRISLIDAKTGSTIVFTAKSEVYKTNPAGEPQVIIDADLWTDDRNGVVPDLKVQYDF